MTAFFRTILISLFAGIILIYAGFYFFQRKILYLPPDFVPLKKNFHANDMSLVHFTTNDKLTLYAWYKKAKGNKPTFLFFHGNGSHIGSSMPYARGLLDKGYGALLFSYRGYVKNPGFPTEKGLYQDALAAFHFLKQQGVKCVILFGRSLGTGVAVQLASQVRIASLILISPFTSITAMAKFHYPFIFIEPADKFDSLGKIKHIHTPVLIIHGNKDKVVPISSGKKLFKKAQSPKMFITQYEKGHNDLNYKKIIHSVLYFIKKNHKENCH